MVTEVEHRTGGNLTAVGENLDDAKSLEHQIMEGLTWLR